LRFHLSVQFIDSSGLGQILDHLEFDEIRRDLAIGIEFIGAITAPSRSFYPDIDTCGNCAYLFLKKLKILD